MKSLTVSPCDKIKMAGMLLAYDFFAWLAGQRPDDDVHVQLQLRVESESPAISRTRMKFDVAEDFVCLTVVMQSKGQTVSDVTVRSHLPYVAHVWSVYRGWKKQKPEERNMGHLDTFFSGIPTDDCYLLLDKYQRNE